MQKVSIDAGLLLAAFGLAGMFSAQAAVTNLSANFDAETAGYAPAGWNIDTQNGYGLVSSATYTSSPNSFLVANTNAGSSAYAIKTLAPSVASNYDGAVEALFSIRLAQTNSLALITMNDDTGAIVAGVCFNGAGAIQAYGQAGYITIASNYVANTWYDVELKYIPAQNKFNVNIGRGSGVYGVRTGSLSGLTVANTNRSSVYFSIQNYGLHDGAGNPLPGTASTYFDNIVVRQTDNIALNKSYAWSYAPTYSLCTDSNDVTQLTDGEFARGRGWILPQCVGWISRSTMCTLTVDLGSDMPICGAMYSAWAYLPHNILMFTSTDGTNYEHAIADLISADTDFIPTSFYVHKFLADTLRTHGRYVRFVVFLLDCAYNASSCAFCDEIEIYKGDTAWLSEPIAGPLVLSTTDMGVQSRLYEDLHLAKLAVTTNTSISAPQRAQLLADLANAEIGFTNYTPVTNAMIYRAILPLTPVAGTSSPHADILSAHGALAQAAGKPALAAWVVPHLDPLETTQQPPVSPVTNLLVAAMKDESQPGTIDIFNATTSSISASISITGLPDGDNPSWVTVNNVEWVDCGWYGMCKHPAASALTPLSLQEGVGYPTVIPAGMVRQIWLDFKPPTNLAAGTYAGNVIITPSTGAALQVPVSLYVFHQTFPGTPELGVSGFDYTDAQFATPASRAYDLTPANITQFISIVYSKLVRTTWAVDDALPYGTYNSSGNMITPPSTNKFAGWVARWPTNMDYRVFKNVSSGIGALTQGTPAFSNAVKNWVTFWANHLSSNGIAPSRLYILLVDEPNDASEAQRFINWATPIREANTGIKLWEDPAWTYPSNAPAAFWPLCDVLCPYRQAYIKYGQSFENFYRNQRAQGRSLGFYDTPMTRSVDPYSVYRLQAWDCFYMGAKETAYWAFCHSGFSGSWNEYAATYFSFTPLYLGSNTANTAKCMEAIRLSVQDYEYLYQLSNRIVQAEAVNSNHPSLPAARYLRDTACAEVLGAANADDVYWYTSAPKDRTVADDVRIEIGYMLDLISPVILLEDGFETDFSKWDDAETTDWERATNQFYSGSYSAHAGESCTTLISDNLDTAGKGTIRIEFQYRDDDIDTVNEVCLELFDGSNYDQRVDLGGTEPEDTWHKCDIAITNSGADAQYFRSDFRIKFAGQHIDSDENLWIDDVKVTAE